MPQDHSPARQGRLIRTREMADRLGVSRVTLWRLVKRGELAAPVRPTPGIAAWFETDANRYLEKLEQQRNTS